MKLVLVNINLKNKKLKIKKENISGIDLIYLSLNKKCIKNLSKKIYSKIFKIYLRKIVLKGEESIFILSKDTRNFSLDKYFDFGFENYILKNGIRSNSINYIENIDLSSNVLIITNEIDKDLLSKYVEKFKEVNIYTENISRFLNLSKKLEDEYGAVINVYDKNSNMYINVDIAVYLDDIHIDGKVKAKKNYFLTENTLDKFSKEYSIYMKYKEDIKQSYNYPERKLALAVTYLHNFNQKR